MSRPPLSLPTSILAFEYLSHFFGRFLAATGKPQFNNGIQAVSEKFNMIFNVAVYMLLFCPFSIVYADQMLIIISQLKIGSIENLVFFDMPKHP